MPDIYFLGEYEKKATSSDPLVQSGRGQSYDPVTLLHTMGEVLKVLDIHAGQDILDAGCGAGLMSIIPCWLGARVTAIDPLDKLVVATRSNLAGSGFARTHQGHLASIPYDNQSFDRILVMEVLQLLPQGEVSRAFDELERVARHGARIMFGSVPDMAYRESFLSTYLEGVNKANHLSDAEKRSIRKRNLQSRWYDPKTLQSDWEQRGHVVQIVKPSNFHPSREGRFHLVVDVE